MNQNWNLSAKSDPPILVKYHDELRLGYQTWQNRRGCLKKLDAFLKKSGKSIEEFNSTDLDGFYAELARRKEKGEIKECTLQKYIRIVKMFAKWLSRQGLFVSDTETWLSTKNGRLIDFNNLPPILVQYYQYVSVNGRTAKARLYALRRFHEFLVKKHSKGIDKLKASDLLEYLSELRQAKEKKLISQNSIRAYAVIIKMFAKWLKREALITVEEYSKIEEDVADVPHEIGEDHRICVSDEEQKILEQKLTLPLQKQLVWTGNNFGFRRQEYCNLRICHLEMDREKPRIKIELSKGHSQKTRYIRMFPTQLEMWKRWLNFIKFLNLKHDYVFFHPKTLERLDKDGVSYIFQQISDISGLKLYSHRLRYTYAVNLFRHGVEVLIISRCLGHSRIDTTIKYLKCPEEEFDNKFDDQTKGFFH
ncbi:MAG: site-specific integrase [Candidatus Bathyarchaeota archaeon]|nr:site-specific integrase [Candidatus Bathyarchaeota archaeon]